jgi:hypothetical protein
MEEYEMAGACSTHGRDDKLYILVGESEGLRGRWEDNIRIYLREIGRDFVDWMHLSQDWGQWRVLVNTVTKLWVH